MSSSGGSGFGPSLSPPEPFFKDFRVPEPEVFESGQARARPEPEGKARGCGYPKAMFYKAHYVPKCYAAKKISEI